MANLNVAVLTSEKVLNGLLEIVYVSHNEDGSWEFWGNEYINESEIRVISLAQIMKIDSSIETIINIPDGSTAKRNDKKSFWIIND